MTALRWTLVGLAVLALAAYAGIVLLLFTHQREMLFVRGRTAHERDAIADGHVFSR